MQTTGSQSQQAGQKMILFQSGVLGLSATVLMTVVFFVFFYRFLSSFLRKQARLYKELSRARLLAKMGDVLNGSILPVREKIKQVGRLLASEGEKEGWRCRIVVHDDDSFLPPSGGSLGFHLSMLVEGQTVGTLIITAGPKQLDAIDQNFFDALTRTLALFIHKEKLWDDFHADLERMQASLLLHADTAPQGLSDTNLPDHRTVEHMLGMLGLVQGKVEAPKPRY